jgi:hypothetical protein
MKGSRFSEGGSLLARIRARKAVRTRAQRSRLQHLTHGSGQDIIEAVVENR